MGDKTAQDIGVLLEGAANVVPTRLTAKHEVVEPAEQPQGRIPPRRRLDDRAHARVVGETPAEVGIERRAALALGRLVEEDLALSLVQLESADFAFAAIAAKASGSDTARSASIFRSSVISAFRQPATNWL